jgi:hypothetical protein
VNGVATCKGDWLLGTACGKCSRCAELAPKAIKTLQLDIDMYKSAWLRSLGGRLFRKGHMIDALVKTTTIMREELEAYRAAEWKAVEDQQEKEYTRGEPASVTYPIRIENPQWN